MSIRSFPVDGYNVEVEVTHFIPEQPLRWGSTPEDSDLGEDYELEFDILSLNHISDTAGDELGELPTREDIEEKLVSILH